MKGERPLLRRTMTDSFPRTAFSVGGASSMFRSQSSTDGLAYKQLSRRLSFIAGRSVSVTLGSSMDPNPLYDDDEFESLTACSKEPTSFKDLPSNCIVRIMIGLNDVQEWLNYKLVCKKWNHLANLALLGLKVRELTPSRLSGMLRMLPQFPRLASLQTSTTSSEVIQEELFRGISRACPQLKSLHIVHKLDLEEKPHPCLHMSSACLDHLFSELYGLEELTVAISELHPEKLPPLAVPSSLGNLVHLQSLALHIPSLESLPDSIGNLSALKELDIDSQALKRLPDTIENLESLSCLTLSHCSSLESLPESLGNLSRLTVLDLHHCSSLRHLPGTISTCPDLHRLVLQNCSSLVELPRTLGCLRNLSELDLQGCSSISQLPRSISRLKKLTSLELAGCPRLKTLPSFLLELPSLVKFTIDESPKFENCKRTGFDNSMLEDDLVFNTFEFAR